ncbi:MAG: hypothetical protein JWP35_4656 [Caulobacter sp.]|nr:hypothetical protein [Caulobacter sp.]
MATEVKSPGRAATLHVGQICPAPQVGQVGQKPYRGLSLSRCPTPVLGDLASSKFQHQPPAPKIGPKAWTDADWETVKTARGLVRPTPYADLGRQLGRTPKSVREKFEAEMRAERDGTARDRQDWRSAQILGSGLGDERFVKKLMEGGGHTRSVTVKRVSAVKWPEPAVFTVYFGPDGQPRPCRMAWCQCIATGGKPCPRRKELKL